jgi:hypothetical protein
MARQVRHCLDAYAGATRVPARHANPAAAERISVKLSARRAAALLF